MLAIRLQRAGRKSYPTYKVIVQDAHRHPTSGKIVAFVGSYNPHSKKVSLNKEIIEKYLSNGAQPTPRVIRLLQDAKIKLPKWVELPKTDAKKAVRNPEKLRKNRTGETTEPEVVKENKEEAEVKTENEKKTEVEDDVVNEDEKVEEVAQATEEKEAE